MLNKAHLRVITRKDKMDVDGKVPLYWEARINGKDVKSSTGQKIEPKYWDSGTKRAKKGCGYSQSLNTYLNQRFIDFENFVLAHEKEQKIITTKKVKAFFDGGDRMTFYDFFERTMKQWVGDKKQATLNAYQNTLNIMKLMEPELAFEEVTYEYVQKWDYYLKTVRNNSINGRYNRHKCFKAIIKEAIKQGYMKENPYNYFKIRQQQSKREFLTIDEVKHLMHYQLPQKMHRLQRSLDMFMFACFTGLRYSDVVRVNWGHIELNEDETKGLLTLEMQKTGKELKTVLIEPAIDILKRYRRDDLDEPVFPYITDNALNRNIKVIMADAGIEKYLTFHCSRHTFASNHLEIETPIAYLKDLLGHSSVEQTQIYAKSLQKSLVGAMEKFGSIYSKQDDDSAENQVA